MQLDLGATRSYHADVDFIEEGTKMGWKNIFFAVSLLGSLVAPAYTNGKLVNVQVQKAYLPIGFDDNDRVQIAVAGTFHDSCYTISTTGVLVSEATKTIHLWQSAFRRTGLCLQIPIPFSQVVNVGKLEAANYSLCPVFS